MIDCSRSRFLPALLALTTTTTTGCAIDFARQSRSTNEPLSATTSGNRIVFRQGDAAIDEHDYYRIAGDQALADQIHAKRARGILANRAGIVLAIAGAVLLGAGLTTGKGSVTAGGALLLPIGGVSMFWGKSTTEKSPQLKLQDARIAGDRYNVRVAR